MTPPGGVAVGAAPAAAVGVGRLQLTRIDEAAALPELTVTVTPAAFAESGVIVLVALPPVVFVVIGFAVPSATTLNVTGVLSATLLPAESVTFAVTVELDVPLQSIEAGEAVSAIAAGTPVTVIANFLTTAAVSPEIAVAPVVAVAF